MGVPHHGLAHRHVRRPQPLDRRARPIRARDAYGAGCSAGEHHGRRAGQRVPRARPRPAHARPGTTRLGWTTVGLGLVALAAAAKLRRDTGHRVAVALGLLVPAVVCFTTVGALWYLPGILLLLAGALVLAGARRDELAAAVDERQWSVALVVLCGAFYIFLGTTALGFSGIVGIFGGLLIWAAVRIASRSHGTAYALLLAGAIPFTVLTWWSAITPFIAILTLAIGRSVIRQAGGGLPAGETATPTAKGRGLATHRT